VGLVWCFERLFVKAPSGRPRVNVLTALHAITHEGFTVQNPTYITAETACALLRLLAGSQPGVTTTIILDNARDRRCALVQTVAQELGIELLYLPIYSPNLRLMNDCGNLSRSRVSTRSAIPIVNHFSKPPWNVLNKRLPPIKRS
jgi:hypothetical protein